jgi:hypothetical protein
VRRRRVARVLGVTLLLLGAAALAIFYGISSTNHATGTHKNPSSASVATSAAKPVASHPGPSNTGVPVGTALSDYTGPCTITAPKTVIDSKTVRCTLFIRAQGVKILRSRIFDHVYADAATASVTVQDSEVDAGQWIGAAIGFQNMVITRVNVQGGESSILCSVNCVIEDSWLHGQYLHPDAAEHLNGYMSNGGHDVVLRHNTIECSAADNEHGGGCSGDAQIYGDFSTVHDYTFDRNLFMSTSGGFCGSFGWNPNKKFGSDPANIVVSKNVFQRGPHGKCGIWGAGTSFKPGAGSVWSGNTWDDGTPLSAS